MNTLLLFVVGDVQGRVKANIHYNFRPLITCRNDIIYIIRDVSQVNSTVSL